MLSYLQTNEPYELKKVGTNTFCTKTHDSLIISNGKWNWFSRGFGGRTALDYLVKVREMSFVEAVQVLCGRGAVQPVVPCEAQKTTGPLILPKTARFASKVITYLQGRGINAEVIEQCWKDGIVYQNDKYQNCMFVGYDKNGIAKHCSIRGTIGDFKLDVLGSDKRFSFCYPNRNRPCSRLFVSESPIDALSLVTLAKLKGVDYSADTFLSLSGLSSLPIIQFLKEHTETKQIYLCLDNDEPGRNGIKKIAVEIQENQKFSERGIQIMETPSPQGVGKDYNDFLMAKLKSLKKSTGK